MKINFEKPIGPVKPMHGINNAPVQWTFCDLFHYLTEAAIPVSRLHDTGGVMGGGVYVDVANVFPCFDADPTDPKSYEFGFTDHLLRELVAAEVKPFYRLGCSIENYHSSIGPRRSIPPKDPHKWAVICEHIIRHYNEGWANGYAMDIQYWEIWNEPDNEPVPEENPMWRGSMEEFFTLYEVAARHLKGCFPHLKIGGYASCGFYEILHTAAAGQAHVSTRTGYFIEFFEKFLANITAEEHRAPLDFFSWHSYAGVAENLRFAAYARQKLDECGLTETESILNEWNPGVHRRGLLADAAHVGAMMVALQHSAVDMLAYYDGQIESTYCGLFDPLTRTPFKAYYAFRAFGEVYRLGYQYPIEGVGEGGLVADGLYAMAAGSADGAKRAVLLFNVGSEREIEVPAGSYTEYRLDQEHDLSPVGTVSEGDRVTVPAEGALLLMN